MCAGAALVACKMLKGMAQIAEVWHEAELVADLLTNADYFEHLAVQTIDNMYEMSREETYASLVAQLPFRWSQNVTPLSLADSAECMKFMGHASCQTFLNLIWMRYMDLDTAAWKLLPIFAFCPLNILMITFDEGNISFNTNRRRTAGDEGGSKLEESMRHSTRHNRLSVGEASLNGTSRAACHTLFISLFCNTLK